MFPLKNPDHQRVVDEFVSALEGFLGVEKTTFSLDDLWRSTRPEGSEGDTVNEFFGSVSYCIRLARFILTKVQAGSDPYRYDSWHGFAKFRADYQMKFNAEAYVGPYMQWFW